MRTLLLVLLGLASHACAAETCPPKEDVYPCTCEAEVDLDLLLTCSHPKLTLKSLKEALNSVSGKKNIDLFVEGLDAGKVPSNFFANLGIKKLGINRCSVDSLSDDDRPGFLGLEDSLESLTITNSIREDNNPASLSFGNLRRLKAFDISSNTITQLSDSWFDRGQSALASVTIVNNGIEKVGIKAFADLIKLGRLTFAGNRFGALKRSMLPNPAPNLELLCFDNNALTDLPQDLFSNMPELHIVSFINNGILRLDERTWQPFWRLLDAIHLEGNPITCDSKMEWLFSLRKTYDIYGTCQRPEDVKGLTLREFIDRQST